MKTIWQLNGLRLVRMALRFAAAIMSMHSRCTMCKPLSFVPTWERYEQNAGVRRPQLKPVLLAKNCKRYRLQFASEYRIIFQSRVSSCSESTRWEKWYDGNEWYTLPWENVLVAELRSFAGLKISCRTQSCGTVTWHEGASCVSSTSVCMDKSTWRRCRVRIKRNNIIWMFPKIGVPKNWWFIMENPIKMADLGVPLLGNTHIYIPFMNHSWIIHESFMWSLNRWSTSLPRLTNSLWCFLRW